MRTFARCLVALAFLLGHAQLANAGSVSVTQSAPSAIPIPAFDPLFGTLTDVTLEVTTFMNTSGVGNHVHGHGPAFVIGVTTTDGNHSLGFSFPTASGNGLVIPGFSTSTAAAGAHAHEVCCFFGTQTSANGGHGHSVSTAGQTLNFSGSGLSPFLGGSDFSLGFATPVTSSVGSHQHFLFAFSTDFRGAHNHSVPSTWQTVTTFVFDPQPQVKEQRKCMVELGKNFAKVAKAQGKDVCKCIKDGAKGKLGNQSIEACLLADRKGKVAKAKAKTVAKAAKKCPADPNSTLFPDFGATDPNTVNQAATDKEFSLIHAIFGSDLNTAILLRDEFNKDASKCQLAAAKQAKKCQDAKLKVYGKCKKNGIAKPKGNPEIQSGVDLMEACLQTDPNDPISAGQPDPKGKIAKACDFKLEAKLTKKCTGVTILTAFPGECSGAGDLGALKSCLDQLVECEVCLAINVADGLKRDCDFFDDGVANASCP